MQTSCQFCEKTFSFTPPKFCSTSCRVKSHRHPSISKTVPHSKISEPRRIPLKTDQNNPLIKEYVKAIQKAKSLPLCKHGYMVGLCKYHCTLISKNSGKSVV